MSDNHRRSRSIGRAPAASCRLAPVAEAFTRDIMGGVTGVTAGSGRIVLRVHPDADWRAGLPYAIAHEMHHRYWAGRHFDAKQPFTLADYLVLEGRAEYFARSLFTHDVPWIAFPAIEPGGDDRRASRRVHAPPSRRVTS